MCRPRIWGSSVEYRCTALYYHFNKPCARPRFPWPGTTFSSNSLIRLLVSRLSTEGGFKINISEIQFQINDDGALEIDASHISKMGLIPGDNIFVSFFDTDSVQDLLLSPTPLDQIPPSPRISIPDSLLNSANISPEADLQILCINGAIIITCDASFTFDELSDILDILSRLSANYTPNTHEPPPSAAP